MISKNNGKWYYYTTTTGTEFTTSTDGGMMTGREFYSRLVDELPDEYDIEPVLEAAKRAAGLRDDYSRDSKKSYTEGY